jgi:hypothetical protein
MNDRGLWPVYGALRLTIVLALMGTTAACGVGYPAATPSSSPSFTRSGGENWYRGPPGNGATIAVSGTSPLEPFYSGSPMSSDSQETPAPSANPNRSTAGTQRRATPPRTGSTPRDARPDDSDASQSSTSSQSSVRETSVPGEPHVGLQLGFVAPIPLGESFGRDLSGDSAPSPPFMMRADVTGENFGLGVLLFPDVMGETAFGFSLITPWTHFHIGQLRASVGNHIDLIFASTDTSLEFVAGSFLLVNFRARYPFHRTFSAVAQADFGPGFLVSSGDSDSSFAAALLFSMGFGIEASF